VEKLNRAKTIGLFKQIIMHKIQKYSQLFIC